MPMLEEGGSQYESDVIAKEAMSGFTLSGLFPNSPSRGFRRPVTLHKMVSRYNPLQFWNYPPILGLSGDDRLVLGLAHRR